MVDIRVFKLHTGEEIIAQVISEEQERTGNFSYTVENPCYVTIDGSGRAQFMPFMPLAGERTFELASDDLFFEPREPETNAKQAYKQQHKIGIIEPPQQIITG